MANAAQKPKHAPSAKLALDDVLKSLQDLIRNDLPDVISATEPGAAPVAQAGPGPQPTAQDLILELEAGLADLNALDTGSAPVGPLSGVLAHAPGGDSQTKPPSATATTPTTADAAAGAHKEWVATPESIATSPITPPTVDAHSVLHPAAGQRDDAPVNPDINSLTGVRLEQDPAASLLSEFLRKKTPADPDFLQVAGESAVASNPLVDTPPGATLSEPPRVTSPSVADLDTLLGVNLRDDPAAPPVSEFLQEEPPANSQLAALDNVDLDFSDHAGTFAIERDQSLSSTPDAHHAATDGLSWHAPEFVLPTAEPMDIMLSALDEPATPPAIRNAPSAAPAVSTKKSLGIPPGSLQSQLPLTDPTSNPRYADPPRPSADLNAARISPATPTSPAATTARAPNLNPTNWDNIPLLQDVIDAVESPASSRTPAPNPSAEQARRMAIQVAARLNVELRRSGKHALSSDVITRLARVLQETLALSPPNVDNKPHNKN